MNITAYEMNAKIQMAKEETPAATSLWEAESGDGAVAVAVKLLPQKGRPWLASLWDTKTKKMIISRSANSELSKEAAAGFLVGIGTDIIEGKVAIENAKAEKQKRMSEEKKGNARAKKRKAREGTAQEPEAKGAKKAGKKAPKSKAKAKGKASTEVQEPDQDDVAHGEADDSWFDPDQNVDDGDADESSIDASSTESDAPLATLARTEQPSASTAAGDKNTRMWGKTSPHKKAGPSVSEAMGDCARVLDLVPVKDRVATSLMNTKRSGQAPWKSGALGGPAEEKAGPAPESADCPRPARDFSDEPQFTGGSQRPEVADGAEASQAIELLDTDGEELEAPEVAAGEEASQAPDSREAPEIVNSMIPVGMFDNLTIAGFGSFAHARSRVNNS